MDTLHNPLRLALAIDGHASQAIEAGDDHRCTRFTIY